MQDTLSIPASNKLAWTGRIISGFVAAFLILASATPKLIGHASATEGWTRFGYDPSIGFGIGIVELACAVLYAIPRTSVLGTILMTGLLGGATATHLRIGDPWYAFPIVMGVLAWAGLFLRDERLRALIPLRRGPAA